MTGSKSTSEDRHARAAARDARVRRAGLGGALLIALMLAVLAGPLFAEPLFDRYQRWLPRKIPATRVLIVRIDAESLKALGPWPWPRSYLAALTDRLREGGAAAIGYDLLFAEGDASNPKRFVDQFPALSPAARAEVAALEPLDEALANAAGRLPVVVARTGVSGNAAEAAGVAEQPLAVEARFAGALPADITSYARATGNVGALEFTAAGQGVINSEPDIDGVTRRLTMAARLAGVPTPGLALDLTRVALDSETIEVRSGALNVGGHAVPIAADGRARLWFGTLPDGAEVPAVNVLRTPRTALPYKDRIVLIGPASVGLGDVRTTPLGTTEFGVRLHAQAVDAILHGGWLARPAWALPAEWTLGGILALVAILGFPRWGAPRSALLSLGISAAVFSGSWTAFAGWQLLLDPVRPVLIGFVTGVAITIAEFVETGRAARRLRDDALAQAGEMKAARDIQRAMLLDPAALDAIDPRLDIDAWLEPAREIGGDLYDAFRLGDGRVAFLIGDVTGKGAPAALFMAVSKALAHSLLRRGGLPLDEAVTALNVELAIDSIVEVTMLCGIIDPANGAVEMVNAGHENPWVIRAGAPPEELAMEGGLPLCTLPGYVYPLERTQLAPGEGLVFITDGVREAQDAAGGFFGSERTRDLLSGWQADEPAHTLTTRLVAAVRAFEAGTPPSDDLTVLALRYRG